MLRTLTIDLKKDCPAYAYLKRNTTGTRALRNTALFYLRNTMTALRKSPGERTKLETEVLHDVFTGLHMANEAKGKRYRERMLRLKASGMHGMPVYGYIMGAVRDAKPLPYPDETHWCLSYAQLDAILKFTKNPSYYGCTSQVNQQAVKKTVQAWKSWLAALSDWQEHPGKYRAKPKMPGYIRTKEATAHFTSQVAKVTAAGDGCLRLTFSTPRGWERAPVLYLGSASLLKGKYVKLEVKPYHGKYRLLLTYEDKTEMPGRPDHPERILGLDPGLDNFLSGLTNTGAPPFLISGKWLKSRNQWFNKERARLLSARTKGKDSRHSEKASRRLSALSRKREDTFRDFFYKAAHWVCRYCVRYRIEAIVIGHNEGQKQEIPFRKKDNQNFVSIPVSRFLLCLLSVAARYGLPVIIREESYTSKASLRDGDPIPTYGADDPKDSNAFSGKRIKRGLYRAGDGTEWNADLNGAGNILRKEYPYAFDGKEPTASPIQVITRERLCHAKKKATAATYRRKKSLISRLRHEERKERRRACQEAFAA